MGEKVFIQRSRVGRVVFTLKERHLSIVRGKVTINVDVTELRDEVRYVSFRSYPGICIFLGLALCTGALTRYFAFLPEGLYGFVVLFGSIAASMFVVVAFQFISKLEFARFSNRTGDRAFDIMIEKAQAAESTSFIQAVRDAMSAYR
jgi:hypothetical protein